MRVARIHYSVDEMQWLEANRMMVISDYHRAFCAAFNRQDVKAIHLHGLRKRKGWKVGRDPDRYIGRGRSYSPAEIAWLRDNRTLAIADLHQAFQENFDRPEVTAAKLHSLRKREGLKTGRTGHFEKGSEPWSKGKKIGNNPGSARTQFKKGSRSGVALDQYKPIGFERVTDGYLVRKINDSLPLQARWRAVHILNWEQTNGPMPEGHCLKCLDGDTLNVSLSNWELVPRGLLPRLNGKSGRNYDNAPDELKPTIMAVAKLEHRARQKRTASA